VSTRARSIATRRPAARSTRRSSAIKLRPAASPSFGVLAAAAFFIGIIGSFAIWQIHIRYTFSLQSPALVHFQWPLVIAPRTLSEDAAQARADQHGHSLTAYQQYACAKFGSECRVALAIQRAENPQGRCEVYHYNSDGTLDWGYFQINTVHLKRPGLNLRDLLDCKANIDFAYQLYQEKQGFTPWSTYNSGAYRKFLHN
jgi:hypothetical protein